MPKIRRRNLPELLMQHLVARVRERKVTLEQLEEFSDWLAIDAIVPEGRWFKRFGGFSICGEGELVKTVLISGQLPDGEEVF
jgi:hypothetical protein